jgi:hypothetical protein
VTQPTDPSVASVFCFRGTPASLHLGMHRLSRGGWCPERAWSALR